MMKDPPWHEPLKERGQFLAIESEAQGQQSLPNEYEANQRIVWNEVTRIIRSLDCNEEDGVAETGLQERRTLDPAPEPFRPGHHFGFVK